MQSYRQYFDATNLRNRLERSFVIIRVVRLSKLRVPHLVYRIAEPHQRIEEPIQEEGNLMKPIIETARLAIYMSSALSVILGSTCLSD
jgi:hypothetical protein